jgi:hypothetical protein
MFLVEPEQTVNRRVAPSKSRAGCTTCAGLTGRSTALSTLGAALDLVGATTALAQAVRSLRSSSCPPTINNRTLTQPVTNIHHEAAT